MNKLGTVDTIATTISQPQPPQAPKFDYPTEIVKLPSKGLLYPENSSLSKGEIEVKYMTAKEEDILSTQSYIANGLVIDKICESIIVTPGVNYNDLLIGDKNAVLLAARMYGYGPEYKTSIVTTDGRQIPITVDLTQVPHKEIDESLITKGENRFKFTLPKSGYEIEFKLLTVGDQKKINADLKSLEKHGINKAAQNLTTRLRFMILSVQGKSDSATINKFVQNMLAMDSRALREYIQQIQPDIDLKVDAEDPQTGAMFQGNFKVGLDLLYPDYEG
jgi:hypothetical protein